MPPNVVVLADDLIWMSRLAAAVERAGANAVRVGGEDRLRAVLVGAETATAAVLVDLNGRGYDGLAALAAARDAGAPAIAVGQHEDLELRRRALAAGARQVYSYNRFFRDGPRLVGRLLGEVSDDSPAAAATSPTTSEVGG